MLNGMSLQKTERNSSFEILRIIAIIFIIATHFSGHGAFDFSTTSNTPLIVFNKIWLDLILLGCVGNNLFVLISAYFLIDNNKFSLKKVLTIILEMLTFSIIIGFTFIIVDKKAFSLTLLKSILFPFGSETWWFITTYLIMYLFSPLLNLGIRAMNRKMHLALIIIFLVLWSFLPTFIFETYARSNFGWFIVLYLIASYIKIYDINVKFKPWVGILLSIGLFLVVFSIKWGLKLAFDGNGFVGDQIIPWFDVSKNTNIFQVCCTILLFISFRKIKMKNCKFINLIASTTLAIYMFHEHSDVRNFLWIRLFKNASYGNSPYLFIYSIGVILAVFVVGVLIGLLYKYTFQIIYLKIVNVLDRKWLHRIDNAFNNNQIKQD